MFQDSGPLAVMTVMADKTSEQLAGELDTPEKCLAALSGLMAGSVVCVMKAAEVLALMESRSYDISSLSGTTIRFLRRVHARAVLPEVFLAFTGRLRSNVAQLAVAEQRRLLDGGTVPLLILKDTGPEILDADPRKLTSNQVGQVFNGGLIRDPAEQRTYLEDERLRTINADVTPLKDMVQVLHGRGGIIVSGIFITKRELQMYLDALNNHRRTPRSTPDGCNPEDGEGAEA